MRTNKAYRKKCKQSIKATWLLNGKIRILTQMDFKAMHPVTVYIYISLKYFVIAILSISTLSICEIS